jgi:2-octaprenyl-6-methoxyphenol hydroxylase
MTHDADILIVGGGLNGPSLALALAKAGAVLDRDRRAARRTRKGAEFDGRSYALALASVRMLGALGLWDGLADDAQPILEIKASDGRAGEGAAPFSCISTMPRSRKARWATCSRTATCAAPARRDGGEPLVTHMPGAKVVAQDTENAARGHARRRPPPDAGASGRRRRAAQRHGRARRHQADRLGLRADGAGLRHRPRKTAQRHRASVLHARRAARDPAPARQPLLHRLVRAHRARRRDRGDGRRRLSRGAAPAFGDFLGEIELAGARYSYPLSLSIADAFVAPRLALVGDAAHGVHPIAGQGLNLGLRDVAALAEVLTDARRRGEDIAAPDVLARYQTWRRFDTAAMAVATDAFNRLFSNDNPLLRAVRDAGMGLVQAAPALRRRFIREAAGLTGDVPRLLQGRRSDAGRRIPFIFQKYAIRTAHPTRQRPGQSSCRASSSSMIGMPLRIG